MKREDLAKFTSDATDGAYCQVSDERIKEFFKLYDSEDKGYVESDDFLDFYNKAAKSNFSKLNTVRQNLKSLGYGKDLRLKAQSASSSHERSFIRVQLSQNAEFCGKLEKMVRKSEEEGSFSGDDHLVGLVELMCPFQCKLSRLIENPLQELKKDRNSQYLLKMDYMLLNCLLFNKKFVSPFLKLTATSYERGALAQKVFVQDFFTQSLLSWNKITGETLFYVSRLLEQMVKLPTERSSPGFIELSFNFITYYMKSKRKKKEEELAKEQGDKKEEKKEKKKEKLSFKDKSDLRQKNALAIIEKAVDGEFLQRFSEKIDLQKLNKLIITSLMEILNFEIISKLSKKLLKTLIILFAASLTMQPDNLTTLLNEKDDQQGKPHLKNLVFTGLTSSYGLIRVFFKNFYAYITSISTDYEIKAQFLSLLIDNIKNNQSEDIHTLIELAGALLSEISEQKELNTQFDFKKIFEEFSGKLLKHESKELSFQDSEDTLLIAYLSFMEKILKADQSISESMKREDKQ